MHTRRYSFVLALFFLITSGLLISPQPAHAQTTASLVVNTAVDELANPGVGCSLREAIIAANNNANGNGCIASGTYGNELISFSGALDITLTSALPAITSNMTIDGQGAGPQEINGAGAYRIFSMDTIGISVTIQDLTLTNGFVGGFGGTGSLINKGRGALTLQNMEFINGSSADSGGAIFQNTFSNGSMTIRNSTFSGNNANFGDAIYNDGTLNLTNVTFSGNPALGSYAIYHAAGGLTINNSTFANSSGIYQLSGSVTLTNSIMQDSTCFGSVSGANNVTTGATGCPDGDSFSVAAINLGTLQNNGGGTRTFALLNGSLAIEAGSNTTCATTDQRGTARPLDGDSNGTATCDAGAFEAAVGTTTTPVVSVTAFDATANEPSPTDNGTFRISRTGNLTTALSVNVSMSGTATNGSDYTTITGPITLPANSIFLDVPVSVLDDVPAEAAETVTLTVTAGTGYTVGSPTNATVTIGANDFVVTTTADSGQGSLRQALTNANASADANTITFASGVTGTITLGGTLTILRPVTITGPGAANLTIDGVNSFVIFNILDTFTLQGVTLNRGGTTTTDAAMRVFSGTVVNVTDVILQNSFGVGIDNQGTLTVTNSTIRNNVNNAGIFAFSPVTVTNSTITGNGSGLGSNGGSITLTNSTVSSNTGRGITLEVSGTLTVTNSTISSNGSIGIQTFTSGSITITGSTIASNGGDGVEINNNGLTVTNSTFANNTNRGIFTSGGSTNIRNSTFLNDSIQTVSTTLTNSLMANSPCVSATSGSNNVTTASSNCADGDSFTLAQLNLGTLANNGGSTQTIALLAGSPAIDAGSNTVCAAAPVNNVDQRGNTRPTDGDSNGTATCDVGAFEAPANTTVNTVTVTATDANAAEGGADNGTFRISRTGSTAAALTVNILMSGTATSGSDYTAITSPRTILAGQTFVDVPVSVLNDVAAEAAETVIVTLDSGGYTLGTPSSATVTIAQNDFVVTNTNDAGEGSLRQAIQNANDIIGTDTITFSGVSGTINLLSALPALSTNMTITGPGASALTLNRTGGTYAPLTVSTGATVNLSGLRIQNGSNSGGGAIIVNSGATVNLSSMAFDNNATGAVVSSGALTVTRSLFTGNSGGAVWGLAGSTLTVSNSTFFGNLVSGANPTDGIYYQGSANITVVNNTFNSDSVNLASGSGTFTNNIVQSGTCTGTLTGTNNVTTASSNCPDGDSFTTAQINLGTLADNGGATQTLALLSGSLAIDAGSPTTCSAAPVSNVDQRGNARPTDGDSNGTAVCDAGAFEAATGTTPPPVTIAAQDATAAEGSPVNNGTFRVTRAGSTAAALTVNITVSGTATSATDYTALPASVIIPIGQTFVDVPVTVLNDGSAAEPAETVIATIAAGTGYSIGAPPNDTATVTIAANGFVVTTNADSGQGSLRQAIQNANDITGTDTITFSGVVSPIGLTTALPAVSTNMTITGPGASALTVTRSGVTNFGIFNVSSGVTATISGLTLTNAAGSAAVVNAGTLTLTSVTLSGNSGGVVDNSGTVTINTSTITSNSGALAHISSTNSLTINNSAITSNTGPFDSRDFSVSGTINLNNTTMSNTSANRVGIRNTGSLTITGGSISGYTRSGVDVNGGSLTVTGVTFSGNTSGFRGGAILAAGTTVNVSGSTFTSNTAPSGGGAINLSGTSSLTVSSSTFDSNQATLSGAGGAIYIDTGTTTALVSNSTFVNNQAIGLGGAIWTNSSMTIRNSTIVDIIGNPSALVASFNAVVTLTNSILSNSTCRAFSLGFFNGTNNVTTASSSCPDGDSFTVAQLALGTLANNGGATQTIALLSGSPAIDSASATVCANAPISNLDQRGTARPIDGNGDGTATCDMGAFEAPANTTGAVSVTATDANAAEGGVDNGTFRITRTGSTAAALSVNFTISGTATSGSDYTAITSPVSIPAGQTFVDVTVTAADDVPAEAAETVILTIQSDFAYGVGSPSNATVTIAQNDVVVTNTNDSGEGSLRQAILNSNDLTGIQTITFNAGVTGTINLSSTLPTITSSGNITGPGAASLTVRRNSVTNFGIFSIGSGVTITMTGLTVTQGNAPTGAGILSAGALTLTDMVIITNETTSSTGGAGVASSGTSLTVTNSTFTLNRASGGNGGAILVSAGSATVTGSTFTSNAAAVSGSGGAILVSGTATLSVTNSTFTSNAALGAGGAIANTSTAVNALTVRNSTFVSSSGVSGGAIYSGGGSSTISNSTFSENTGGSGSGSLWAENAGVTVTLVNNTFINSTGGNSGIRSINAAVTLNNSLLANVFCNGTITGANNITTASSACPDGDSFTLAQLAVGSLANNGGSTQTFALLNGSPAIDAGNNTLCANAPVSNLDQRGTARPLDGDGNGTATCDVGAFEAPANTSSTVTVSAFDAAAAEPSPTNNGTFRISRTGSTTAALPVNFTISGTATSGSDYTAITSPVSIPVGQTFVDVTVTLLDDIAAEAAETVILTVNAGTYTLGSPSSATVTIAQNDLIVTNTNDSGEGSLRQAMLNAEAFTGTDTITFNAGVTGTINLASALPTVAAGDVTITGPGAASLTVNSSTLGATRLLTVNTGRIATLTGLTFFGGAPPTGSGFSNSGTLNLTNVTLSNLRSSFGGAIANGVGATVTLTGVTLTGNTAQGTNQGGAIYNTGTATITRSTFSANNAPQGASIYNTGTLTVTNTTFSGNTAVTNGGAILSAGGTVTVQFSTFSSNTTNGIAVTAGTASVNNSLLSSSTCSGTITGANNVTSASSNCPDGDAFTVAQLALGALANNGGSTQTIALLNGSPAIDAGNNTTCAAAPVSNVDQRGTARPVDGDSNGTATCDAGAFEAAVGTSNTVTVSAFDATAAETGGNTGTFRITRTGSTTAALTVNITMSGTATSGSDYSTITSPVTIAAGQTFVDVIVTALDDMPAEANETVILTLNTGAYTLGTTTSATVTIAQNDLVVTNTNDSGEGSLRQAILNANAFVGTDTITFNAGVTGTITLAANSPLPTITDSTTITGPGTGSLTLNGSAVTTAPMITLSGAITVNMSGLTLANAAQGAITHTGATLNLNAVAVNNSTGLVAVNQTSGSLTVTGSIFSSNGAGAISNGGGTTTITNSAFTGNGAVNGAAVRVTGGSLTVTGSTFAMSTGSSAIAATGSGVTTTVSNSTFSSNGAGAISNGTGAALTVINVTFSGNGVGIAHSGASANASNSIFADSTCSSTITGTNNVTTASSGCPDGDAFTLADLALGALANNGGSTLTIALLAGSPAVDAGSNSLCAAAPINNLDQRGFVRPVDGDANTTLVCDAGAFEASEGTVNTVTVSAFDAAAAEGGIDNGTFRITRTGSISAALSVNVTLGGDATLTNDYTLSSSLPIVIPVGQTFVDVTLNAVDDIAAEADETVTLTLLTGTYTIGSPSGATITIAQNDLGVTNTNDSGEGSVRQAVINANTFAGADEVIVPPGSYLFTGGSISVSSDLTITGGGTANTTLNGNGGRALSISSGTVLLRGLTITGGGVTVTGGNVTIGNDPVFIVGNSTTTCGGGLYVGGGIVTVGAGSQINDNTTTDNGGGICVEGLGMLVVQGAGTQVNGNDAGLNGGGIYANGWTVQVQAGASISGNTAEVGGAIYHAAGDVTVTGSFVQQNSGGAISFADSGVRSVTNTCIVLNTDTAVTFAGGSGVVATGNWWGSAFGPFSGLNTPAPNDANTEFSTGDSVTPSNNASVFNYGSYLTVAPSGCFACAAPSGVGGGDRENRMCSLLTP